MTRSGLRVASLLLLSLGYVCCRSEAPAVEILRLADSPSYYRDFEIFVREAAGEEAGTLDESVLAALFSDFVDELCLARLAIERGLAPASSSRREALARLAETVELPAPSDAEVRLYYGRHGEDFMRPLRVVLGQILVQERATADELVRRIRAGTPFGDSAASFGDDAGITFAGYQEDVTLGDLPEGLSDRIFALESGEVSSVIETESGFHLFHLLERLPAEQLSLERARPSIERELRREAADAALESMVQEARVRYNVELLVDNLPFRLQP